MYIDKCLTLETLKGGRLSPMGLTPAELSRFKLSMRSLLLGETERERPIDDTVGLLYVRRLGLFLEIINKKIHDIFITK